MKIEKGELKIDLRQLIESLNSEDLREIARAAAFDVEIIECLCKWMTTGEVDWDEEDGFGSPWYIYRTGPGTVLEKAKKALLPLMGEVSQKFIAELLQDRDQQASLADQCQKKLWELQRVWRDSEFPPRDDLDFSCKYYSKEEVAEEIRAFEQSLQEDSNDTP